MRQQREGRLGDALKLRPRGTLRALREVSRTNFRKRFERALDAGDLPLGTDVANPGEVAMLDRHGRPRPSAGAPDPSCGNSARDASATASRP
jgi:hypothetical protein